MNVKVRKYFLEYLGLCGEILSLRAPARAPAAASTAGDELRRMMGENLIRYHQHPDRKRTFRICDPAGFETIGETDARLLDHAEMLVGKKGARYTGSRDYRLKKRREAVLMSMLAEAGFTVDGMRLEEDRTFTILSPTLTDMETVIKSTPRGETLFTSGALLRRKEVGMSHSRREMSIMAGALFSPGGTYSTYVISTARFRWYAATETAAANDTARLYEDVLNLDRSTDRRFRAILYTTTEAVAAEIIKLSLAGNHRMDPTNIFRLSYIVPTEDSDFASDVTKMLTIRDWHAKTNAVLGLPPLSGNSDGTTKDGRRIYNLLCCNLQKIKEIERDIRRENCRVIIHDWQKPVLETLFEAKLDAVVLTSKHFKGLLLTIQEENA